jgi:signal transduction histidine kinase/CheY-like chemotaxis protein
MEHSLSEHASLVASGGLARSTRRGRVHKLHFVIEQAVRTTVSVVFVVVFVSPFVVPTVGWIPFSAWAAVTLAAYGVRAWLLRPGMRLEAVEKDPRRWVVLLFGSTVICGLIGASAPLLFLSSLAVREQMLVTMIFGCWVTGAMASIGAIPLLYASYVLVFMAQLILAWVVTGDPHVSSIAAALVVYGVVINGFARSFAKQVAAGVEIRFQNEELIQELDAARHAAEAASHQKSRFLAVASHDLRQPLHALTILSGLLARRSTSEKIGEVAEQIVRSVGSFEKLFSSLLDLSRLEVGAMHPELRPTSLASLVRQLETEYETRAGAKGLRFAVRECEVSIVTDPVMLERILRNLIDNAIKYTERGGIELLCERRSDAVVIRVADSGPGIRPEEREAVFEEFYQASDGRRHRETGLGLGLAIVRRLAELLGYTVGIESEVGAGTTIQVLIPASSIAAESAVDARGADAAPTVSLEGFALVYIDDDTHVHGAMELLLREWGCKVVIAPTLEEARAGLRARGLRPEAILSDHSLGANVTGIEVIEALRAEYGPLPAAIITGETSPGAREKLRDSEYPVLLKPAKPEELHKLLEVFRSIG